MKNIVGYIGVAFLLIALAYSGYRYHALDTSFHVAQNDFASTTESLQYSNSELTDKLNASDALVNDLKTLLGVRTQENETASQQVQALGQTVGTLNKLANTDKELLEKYSSVYFLNENYVPASLSAIDAQFLNRPDKSEQFLAGVYPHLLQLLNDAKAQQVPMQVLSAYRSFGTQSALKTSYKITYGAGTANAFSADQGYSEHQLGTALDFTTPSLNGLTGFEKTTAYSWLQANAYKYGFELSYPKGNKYFVFEPWHWRYVGVELATKLHTDGRNFYDMDQRDIDTYLIKFFD